MDTQELIKLGLGGEAPLKLILCGSIQNAGDNKVGVVSVVYATKSKELAEQKIHQLMVERPDNYYMVYSVPLDTELTTLEHYPSIAIDKSDLS